MKYIVRNTMLSKKLAKEHIQLFINVLIKSIIKIMHLKKLKILALKTVKN